jgi:hypothetical protein
LGKPWACAAKSLAWSGGIPHPWMLIPDIRDNGLEDSKSTNRFSEQTYLNQQEEFLFHVK